jgi:hypothetical protein
MPILVGMDEVFSYILKGVASFMDNYGDVWQLEDARQEVASDIINAMYEKAITRQGKRERGILKGLFQCGWDEIKDKMSYEDSTWYVWYMDGVNQLVGKMI